VNIYRGHCKLDDDDVILYTHLAVMLNVNAKIQNIYR